jgi:hypothetical protein
MITQRQALVNNIMIFRVSKYVGCRMPASEGGILSM